MSIIDPAGFPYQPSPSPTSRAMKLSLAGSIPNRKAWRYPFAVTTPDTPSAPESYVHGYEEWTRNWMGQRTAQRELGFLLPHLRPGMELIDCGCGPGSITVGLAELVNPGHVVGVDVEQRQLEAAAEAAAARGAQNIEFKQASIYELPFADASFDCAVAHFVIEHVSDPGRALRELRRVLRPGGLAAIKDPYYPAFTFRPRLPVIVRFEELMDRFRAHHRASPTYAADLRAHLLDAGFARTEATAGTEVAGGSPRQPAVLPMIIGHQLKETAFRDTVIAEGWATAEELDQMVRESAGLEQRADLFGFIVYVAALGWVEGS